MDEFVVGRRVGRMGRHCRCRRPATAVDAGGTLTASATASVANDRMYAWLRAEADNADPARAAAEVNAKMAKALARAKGAAGVEVTTSGYSSYQVTEKNQPTRWRVTQSLSLDGSDFRHDGGAGFEAAGR
jgi:predicted secreted protein